MLSTTSRWSFATSYTLSELKSFRCYWESKEKFHLIRGLRHKTINLYHNKTKTSKNFLFSRSPWRMFYLCDIDWVFSFAQRKVQSFRHIRVSLFTFRRLWQLRSKLFTERNRNCCTTTSEQTETTENLKEWIPDCFINSVWRIILNWMYVYGLFFVWNTSCNNLKNFYASRNNEIPFAN